MVLVHLLNRLLQLIMPRVGRSESMSAKDLSTPSNPSGSFTHELVSSSKDPLPLFGEPDVSTANLPSFHILLHRRTERSGNNLVSEADAENLEPRFQGR